jgi:hypothetical protein
MRRLLALPLMLAAVCACADEADVHREDQLKAAYLFNFVKFVEWPATRIADQALIVCFVGGSGVHDALASGIENKRVGERPLALRRLPDTESDAGCDVLYLESQATASPTFAPKHPMLTISDAKAFASHGGIIELFAESNRLRFKINVDNAQRAGLRISSNLLQLAASVEKAGAQ